MSETLKVNTTLTSLGLKSEEKKVRKKRARTKRERQAIELEMKEQKQ